MTGMIIRELMARTEVDRVLIICPAGLTRNWQQELNDCFRMDFEIVGRDFVADRASAWERHRHVIGSIDKLKRPPHFDRLLTGPKWDLVVFDEAHHLTRRNKGKTITQNYRFAESLRGHTRDILFLSATPHQGDQYQFWSLIRLLDDELFESAEAMLDNRGLLSRVMVRRIKREVTDALGRPIFMRRQVHTQKFALGSAERNFYDRLTEYLREGYGVAGVGQSRTTTEQRAIGFSRAWSDIARPLPDTLERHFVPGNDIAFDQDAADRHVGVTIPAVVADPQGQPVLQSHASRALNLDGERDDRVAQPADLQMPAVERAVLDLAAIEIRHQPAIRQAPPDLAPVGKTVLDAAAGRDEVIGPTVERNREFAGRKPRAIDDRLEIPGEQPLRLAEREIRKGRKLSSKNARALLPSSPGSRRARMLAALVRERVSGRVRLASA